MVDGLDTPLRDDVWYIGEFETWKDIFFNLISDVVNQDVLTAFQANRPENFSSENFEWLNTLARTTNGSFVDVPSLLERRVKERYRAIRAYHGTRTDNITSFYVHGLLVLNPDKVKASVRENFLCERFPEVTETALTEAFEYVDLWREPRENTVYFFTNHNMHSGMCSNHYMSYGSEYMLSIICHLGRAFDSSYQEVIQETGRSTIIVCDVPLVLIPPPTLTALVKESLYDIFSSLLGADYNYQRGYGNLYIIGSLPAENVISHHTI